jgi:WD40 repeat protein
MEGHSGYVNSVAVTPDGRWVVSASSDNTLKVWELQSGREVITIEGHSASVNGVALTPDDRRAVSASRDKTIRVWDLDTGCPIATFTCDAAAYCCTVGATQIIIAGDSGGHIHFLVHGE